MRLGLIVATRHAPRVPASLLASRGMAIKRNRRSRMARPDLTVDKDVRELLENTRVNDQVVETLGPDASVMLIGDEGAVLERKIAAVEALARAQAAGRDLMMVDAKRTPSPDGPPIVCKYIDFDAWLDERKTTLKAKKASQFTEVLKAKEMRFSININEHDADTKCRKIEQFLQSGYSVHMVLFFAPPLPYNAQMGEEFLEGLLDRIPDDAGTCSNFKHSPKQGEVSVELSPMDGQTKGRRIFKKK